jgi:hypothetical protein
MFDPQESEPVNRRDDDATPDIPPLAGELRALGAAYAQLRPTAVGLDRDRLLFLAGQASVSGMAPAVRGSRGGWFWPAATISMTGVAAMLLAALMLRTEPPSVERVVYVNSSALADQRNSARDDRLPGTAIDRSVLDATSPGIRTLTRQLLLGDGPLAAEPFAQISANEPGYQPPVEEDVLSSRSFRQLLDETGKAHDGSNRRQSPTTSVRGAKS